MLSLKLSSVLASLADLSTVDDVFVESHFGDEHMKLIVISPHAQLPTTVEGAEATENLEQKIVAKICDEGLTTFHLRKPTYSIDQMRAWLDALPERYHQHIVVHSFYDLALEYNLKGVHLTSTQLHSSNSFCQAQLEFLIDKNPKMQLSASYHTLDELRFSPARYDYVFISPVYDSISKEYNGASFSFEDLQATLPHVRNPVVALGGINSERIKPVLDMGFDGVAVLGAVWNESDPVAAFKEIKSECQIQQDMCLP